MNPRIQELYNKAWFKVDPANPRETFANAFAELIVRECAEWMSDGNIPDGFYEAGRLLEHFGIEE